MDGATSTRVPNDTQAYRRRAMTCLRSLSVQKCRVYSPRSEFPRERKGVWGAESPTPVTGGHPAGRSWVQGVSKRGLAPRNVPF